MKLTIYLDGQFVSADQTILEQLKPGHINRPGVFETMRLIKGRLPFWSEHKERFKRGLKLYGIRPPESMHSIEDNIKKLVRKNQLKQARIRLAVWKASKVHIAMVGQTYHPLTNKQWVKGYKVMFSDIKKNHTRTSHIKSMRYAQCHKAYQEALALGYDEALLRNKYGQLVEGAISNLFIVQKNQLKTPPIKSGCLNGIMRQNVIRLAKQKGYPVKITNLKSRDLNHCDEAFLTNALIGIVPIRQVGPIKIGSAKAGPITQYLNQGYRQYLHQILK